MLRGGRDGRTGVLDLLLEGLGKKLKKSVAGD